MPPPGNRSGRSTMSSSTWTPIRHGSPPCCRTRQPGAADCPAASGAWWSTRTDGCATIAGPAPTGSRSPPWCRSPQRCTSAVTRPAPEAWTPGWTTTCWTTSRELTMRLSEFQGTPVTDREGREVGQVADVVGELRIADDPDEANLLEVLGLVVVERWGVPLSEC